VLLWKKAMLYFLPTDVTICMDASMIKIASYIWPTPLFLLSVRSLSQCKLKRLSTELFWGLCPRDYWKENR
jgi:hypothetical protein